MVTGGLRRVLKKIFVASFNRASDGALSKLIQRMKEEQLWTDDYGKADYILAVGDRRETLHFIIDRYAENKPIIHLWAGEVSQGTHDEVWRGFITEMSTMQLCTNRTALQNLKNRKNAHVIGNLMLDNIEINESLVPDEVYDVVLYNPSTLLERCDIQNEVTEIVNMIYGCSSKPFHKCFWIEPNGDLGSDIVAPYVTHKTLPRPQFLGLVKNCNRFITNSSSMFYEAQFLGMKGMIVPIGVRNSERQSKHSRMDIPGATEKVIELLKGL
jgi:UDP-N-acetylglucosamine 2-epimerase